MQNEQTDNSRLSLYAAFRRIGSKTALTVSSVAVSAMLVLGSIPVVPANATELSDAQKELKAVTAIVEEAQDRYNAAQDAIAAAEDEYARLQEQIDEIEAKLVPHRDQLSDIAKWQYVSGSDSFLDMLFSDDVSLVDIIEQAQYLDKLNEDKVATMEAISESEDELFAAQENQIAAKQEAEDAKAEAQSVIDENQEAIDDLTERIAALREEQREYLYGKGLSGGGPAYDVPEEGDVVDYALSRVGCPYVWGASGPTSFDCSGLVMWAYAQVGISLPHNSEAMYSAAKKVVPLSEARPGDVLYRSGHVGLCTKAGAAEYVHAPTSGAYVRISDNVSWSGFTCALRF